MFRYLILTSICDAYVKRNVDDHRLKFCDDPATMIDDDYAMKIGDDREMETCDVFVTNHFCRRVSIFCRRFSPKSRLNSDATKRCYDVLMNVQTSFVAVDARNSMFWFQMSTSG